MPNPFEKLGKQEETETVSEWETVEGRFGCFEQGCGKVVGEAQYCDKDQLIKFTCPSGHVTELGYLL